jgi:long-chain acyl-CoA synthetase
MISHENLLATAKGHLIRLDQANIKKPITDRHCSFLPMAHIYERFILLQAILSGTQIVFCPAPEQLPNYLSMVKPTQASVVPRVLNRVYDAIMTEVNKSKLKTFLVQQALREQPSFLSHIAFRKVKKLFGNQVKAMITGAAPITPDVMHFFRIALNIPIMEGYGQTESAGAGTTTHPVDLSYGSIGSPMPTVEIKLIDVPGTNYRSAMNQGEVCIRGPNVFKGNSHLTIIFFHCSSIGYYGDEAKTRETVDENGWLHTGDVGEWTSNGALRIIDRTKHIFKLNQGKYIAPERLEDVYIRSRWVAQIFIDGISTEANVVAIVIPDEDYVRKNFKSATTGTTFADLCKNEKLKKIILSDLNRIAEKYKLKMYETVSNIHLHPELFSQNNGLLTVTLKTRRANARKQFQSIIQSLYQKSMKFD